MIKCILMGIAPGILSLALTGSAQVASQSSKADAKTAHETKATADKKPNAGPFHAKLNAVDKAGKTITVGKRVFRITSETKFNKAGKPATLDDAVIGESVSGYVKPNDEGKLVATKVNFGPKTENGSVQDGTKKKK